MAPLPDPTAPDRFWSWLYNAQGPADKAIEAGIAGGVKKQAGKDLRLVGRGIDSLTPSGGVRPSSIIPPVVPISVQQYGKQGAPTGYKGPFPKPLGGMYPDGTQWTPDYGKQPNLGNWQPQWTWRKETGKPKSFIAGADDPDGRAGFFLQNQWGQSYGNWLKTQAPPPGTKGYKAPKSTSSALTRPTFGAAQAAKSTSYDGGTGGVTKNVTPVTKNPLKTNVQPSPDSQDDQQQAPPIDLPSLLSMFNGLQAGPGASSTALANHLDQEFAVPPQLEKLLKNPFQINLDLYKPNKAQQKALAAPSHIDPKLWAAAQANMQFGPAMALLQGQLKDTTGDRAGAVKAAGDAYNPAVAQAQQAATSDQQLIGQQQQTVQQASASLAAALGIGQGAVNDQNASVAQGITKNVTDATASLGATGAALNSQDQQQIGITQQMQGEARTSMGNAYDDKTAALRSQLAGQMLAKGATQSAAEIQARDMNEGYKNNWLTQLGQVQDRRIEGQQTQLDNRNDYIGALANLQNQRIAGEVGKYNVIGQSLTNQGARQSMAFNRIKMMDELMNSELARSMQVTKAADDLKNSKSSRDVNASTVRYNQAQINDLSNKVKDPEYKLSAADRGAMQNRMLSSMRMPDGSRLGPAAAYQSALRTALTIIPERPELASYMARMATESSPNWKFYVGQKGQKWRWDAKSGSYKSGGKKK